MESATRKVMGRLNPNFKSFTPPVKSLSGGQRQAVAIARAVHFNARILIMDEPTAALGPAETAQVRDLVRQLKNEGIGIFLISHDIHDVFDLSDRVSVMYHGKLVDTVDKDDVTKDEVLGMIILGKKPDEVTETDLARSSSAELGRAARAAIAAALAAGGTTARARVQAPVDHRASPRSRSRPARVTRPASRDEAPAAPRRSGTSPRRPPRAAPRRRPRPRPC